MARSNSQFPSDQFDISTRSARFEQPSNQRGVDAPTADGDGRRADFRPPESVAEYREVVEEFRNQMLDESSARDDVAGESAVALQAVVLAEEALGEYERAARRIHGLSRLREPTVADRRLYRRILRATGQDEPVIGSLERSVRDAEEPEASLLALDGAWEAWRRDYPPRAVLTWLHRAAAGGQIDETEWSSYRHHRLRFDVLVEQGQFAEAGQQLDQFADEVEDDALGRLVGLRTAIWKHLRGDLGEAVDELERQFAERESPHPVDDLLVHLAHETGDRAIVDRVRRTRLAAGALPNIWAVPHALDAPADDGTSTHSGVERLRDVTDGQGGDRTLTAVQARLLEDAFADGSSSASVDELIAALNTRLEQVESSGERIATLTRLGELYEREVGLHEAAADVYREVLEIRPDHPAAIRALGRLYARQDNWDALAELYEHELEHLSFSGRKWRHHFRVAELYESKLGDWDRALDHYRATLDARPHYLPALKAVARLLGQLERWTDLVDLFLASVDEAPSRRQKLYLLDRAAEVAERRLDRPDIAIGAWEELLELGEDHPRVFSALGRLYTETGRWSDLLALNLEEIERVEDDDEAAALYLRNAEICETHLGDEERAVEFYRRALTLLPAYLPALEGLGRLYAKTGRWEEIVRMTERELREMKDGPEARRQLGALAEIVDRELDRPEDAAGLYGEVYRRRRDDEHLREALVRLHRAAENWGTVVDLLEERAEATEGRARADVLGELALLEEKRRDRPARAFQYFMEALETDPSNLHWLYGIQRTWPAAEATAGEVADRLEDRVVDPLDTERLDAYFKVIARLREREESTSLASCAHRMHGDRENVENQLALQMSMAESGDRGALLRARQNHTRHPFDALAMMDRLRPDDDELDVLRTQVDRLTDRERQVVGGELPASVGSEFIEADDADPLVLSADLHRLLGDEAMLTLDGDDRARAFPLARLRAVEANRETKYRTFKRWTYDELDARERRDVVVDRLVRLAEVARQTDRLGQSANINRQAAIVVFPDIERERDELHPSIADIDRREPVDASTIEILYDSLIDSGQWELYRTGLKAHVARDGLSDEERVDLFTRLAAICERKLEDWEGAIRARTHCWQISEEPRHLEELVRLDQCADDLDGAIRHQKRHFDETVARETCSPSEMAASGLALAELLLETDERRDEGIEVLESLRDDFPETDHREDLLRTLAYGYRDVGATHEAVETFHTLLETGVTEENLEDWRELVRLQADELENPKAAYALQWRILRAFPTSERTLDTLVDLAYRAGDIEACVERLEALADEVGDGDRQVLLTRAAVVADEDLQMWREAEQLYERVLEQCEPDADETLDLVRRRVLCLSRITGREEEATALFGELLEREPFEPAALRAMLQVFERAQARDRERLSRQVLEVLNCDIDRSDVRTKMKPSRHFDEEAMGRFLLPDSLDLDILHLLTQTVPLAEKVWSDELPQKKVFGGRRIGDEHDGMIEALDAGLTAFDLRKYGAQVGDSGPPAPQVFGSGSPEYWFNEQVIEEMSQAEQYFAAGYVSALGWSGLAPLLELDGRRFWHLIEGTWLKQTGEGFDSRVDVETQKLADEIGSPFLAVTRRRVANAIEPVADRLPEETCELWPEAVREFAARVGLVMCGDLAAAIRCILRFEGWELDFETPETRDQITRMDLLGRLVQFAFSEDYLKARYEVGLTATPDELSV